MNKINKIVYMGTSEFAVPALYALDKSGYSVDLVVTQPDRPKGRGRKLTPPPVKVAALELGYKTLQPENVKTDEFYNILSDIKADLFIVASFGHIITERLLALPGFGSINIHGSLLPEYRGPAPIQWALINGEEKTGVTTMQMDKGLDTGDILLTSETEISIDDTSDLLHDRLAEMGADLLIRTIAGIKAGTIKVIPQNHDKSSYAPMLKKKDGLINWALPAIKIASFIQGVTPWPGAYTFQSGKRLKIFKAQVVQSVGDTEPERPGTIVRGFKNEIRVQTGDGILSILELQKESSRRLPVIDFLKGSKIETGEFLKEF